MSTPRLDVLTPPVARTQIVRFAGAAGDFNPMHHDEPFAQAAGSASVFAMGQLTAAILGEAVATWLGRDALLGYGLRFQAKVLPGDVLRLTGTVTSVAEDGTRACELSVVREVPGDGERAGETAATGWARARPAG